MSARSGSYTADSTSTTLDIDEVTGYKFERDHKNASTINYVDGKGAAAAYNAVGDVDDNNIQQGESTDLDIPGEGMGFYCLNSYNGYSKAGGTKMTGLTGDSRAKLDAYQIASGESIKFIQHAADGAGNSIDYNWTVQGIYSYNSDTQTLINNSTITYTSEAITFNSAGTYYIVINNTGRIELSKINSTGPSRAALAKKARKNKVSSGTTIYLIPGPWASDSAAMYMWYWGDDNSGAWADFSATSYKYNGDVVYSTTLSKNLTSYKIIRNDAGQYDTWSDYWNDSGDQTWSGTNNTLQITQISAYTCSYKNLSTSQFDGWVFIGSNGANSSTFPGTAWTSTGIIRLDAGTDGNAAQKTNVTFNAGDIFKVSYMEGENVLSTTYDYDVVIVNANQTQSDGLKTRYFSSSNAAAASGGNKRILVNETVTASYYIKDVSGYKIYVELGVTSANLTVKAVKFNYNESSHSTDNTVRGTYYSWVGESITTAKLASISLNTSISNYSRVGTSFYSDANCATAITSSFSMTAGKVVYIKMKENSISITLQDSYVPNHNNTNATGTRTTTVTVGAATSYTNDQLKNMWTAVYANPDTRSGYASTFAYKIDGVYTAAYSGSKKSGTLSATTYYVRYVPQTYTLTRKVMFYNNGRTALTGKADIALSNLSINSITSFTTTSPFAQNLHNGTNNLATEAFGYEFYGWQVSYNSGSTWTAVTAGTKPTGNGILAAIFYKLPSSTFYIDASETAAHQPGNENVNDNWNRTMTVYSYAYYSDPDSGVTISNSSSFPGTAATRIFQFYHSIELPNKATTNLNNGYANGSNQTGNIPLQDCLDAGKNMLILGTVYNATYVGWSYGTYVEGWDPKPYVSKSPSETNDFFIVFYNEDGIKFDEAIKMTTGHAEGHESTDQAYKLQIPIQAGTQFAIIRMTTGYKERVNYVYGHESIGSDGGGQLSYVYEEQGDVFGNSSNFAEGLSVDSHNISSTAGMHLFKIKTTGVYDIFINADGVGNNQNKVFFEQCELRLNYSTNNGANWSYRDMYFGDGVVYFSILEDGQQLNTGDYAYVSVKSNNVVSNYGWADLLASDQSKGFCQNSNQKIPAEDSKYSIKFLKSAKYATFVKSVDASLKITFVDMPEEGEGFYICQNDSSYYSFGKAVKMREIDSPGSNADDYYYQYCAYTATAGETIKLMSYIGYTRGEVTSVSGSSSGVSISGSNIITLTNAGLYDIYIKKDGASAILTKRATTTSSFFSLNSYSGMANQNAIKSQNTSIVVKFGISWTAPAAGRTIKIRLIGSNVTKLGLAKTALLADEVSDDTYNSIRTSYYSSLARYSDDVTIGTTASASGSAYFYIIVDYWAGQAITSQTDFKMAVVLFQVKEMEKTVEKKNNSKIKLILLAIILLFATVAAVSITLAAYQPSTVASDSSSEVIDVVVPPGR